MKKGTFVLAALLMCVFTLSAQNKPIDVKLSKVSWLGKKVSGEHSGNIAFKSGSIITDGKKLKGGEFVIDMNSITCTDIENEDYNAKLVGHLKSDDFFGVASYPLSTLTLTEVKANGDAYEVKGDLLIKGKTHVVTFPVTQSGIIFSGTVSIDRTLYDVRYGSGKFFDNLGDKMIDDVFELNFKVALLK